MRNKSLDVLKLISAIFVVFIHITFVGELGIAVNAVARFAVPIFFMCSGFFSYNAITNGDEKKLLKRCIPLLKIFIISIFVYALCEYVFLGEYNFITVLASIKTYIKFFIFNNFGDGFFIPLWFLPALIYTYLSVAIIVRLKLTRLIKFLPLLILAPIIFYYLITGYMGQNITPVIVRNFLFTGLPFFSVGYLLNKNKDSIKRISNFILVLFIIVGVVDTLVECIYLNVDGEIYFGTILVAFGLFELFNRFDLKIQNQRISYYLSKIPLYIYILHPPVNGALRRFGVNSINGYIYPVVVLLATLILAMLITGFKYSIIKLKNSKVPLNS